MISYTNKGSSTITDFCSTQNIKWRYILQRAPHFGGLWESAVRRVKTHLLSVVASVRQILEEFHTILTQVEACMNSRPLIPMNTTDGEGIEVLTPRPFSDWKANYRSS